MIECYVNERGYYINGDVEIARSLLPSTIGDEPKLDPLQHIYAVMYAALADLRGKGGDRVFVYNDSRIIDDLRGAECLSPWFDAVKTMMKQRLIPDVGGVVFFRKKPAREINDQVSLGIKKLHVEDVERDQEFKRRFEDELAKQEAAVKTKAASLKRRWFNAEA